MKDFFIFYDEFRTLDINLAGQSISPSTSPNRFTESSQGNFIIVWDDQYMSKGSLSSADVDNFDEFIHFASQTKLKYDSPIFIPERGIYPMAMNYSKSLADLIDIPEYLLKIGDIALELDQIVRSSSGDCKIEVKEGTRYAYSSKYLDEYYPYTLGTIKKTIDDSFAWNIESSDLISIVKIHELFSFFGDLYNILQNGTPHQLKKTDKYNILLSPEIFERLFTEQILENITFDNVYQNKSPFMLENFEKKLKILGNLSLSYDPLINNKPGTYKFTSQGVKPLKHHFIKVGKLDSMITNTINYAKAGVKVPSPEIAHFSNLKIEGVKKQTFENLKKVSVSTILYVKPDNYSQTTNRSAVLNFNEGIFINKNKLFKVKKNKIAVDLIDLISKNQIELVEFIDGRYGCLIKNM
jgi:predicted Zn-dependent protease